MQKDTYLVGTEGRLGISFKIMSNKGQLKAIHKPPEIITFYTMRRAIGIIGITFPFIMIIGSCLFGECHQIQYSISTYYHTNMRNVYVGLNCAVAFFMFAYRGHDRFDNMAGYLGSIFALGVAFLPCTARTPNPPCLIPTAQIALVGRLHLVFAGLFFLILIVYTLFQFPKTFVDWRTGEKLTMTLQKKKRNVVFYTCGSIMVLSLALIFIYMWFLEDQFPKLDRLQPVFWLESISLFCFGISWLTKGQLFFKDRLLSN